MKFITMFVLIVSLCGCAATRSGDITTGSRFYDAEFAARAGASQAQVARCEAEARQVYWAAAPATAFGSINGVAAGRAFERCVAAR